MKRANVAFFVPHAGCPHDCSFCNQRRISGAAAPPTEEEIREGAQAALTHLGALAQQSEIAFFGGSFTAIPRRQMERYLGAAAPFVGPGKFKGIRVSTRPDAVDPEILTLLCRYGVTSVELGAQSMDDRVLAANNRGHTAADVERASGLIREAGLALGLQMMTGLYRDTPEGAQRTAGRLAALRPDTMRIYPAVVLRGTRLAQLYESGAYRPQALSEAVALCARLLLFFESAGIRVIRLGLHASPGIEEDRLAGPWHPAFRELCENRIYLQKARAALAGLCRGRPALTGAVLLVRPGAVSQLAGQRRAGITALSQEFGVRLKIREDAGLSGFDVSAVPA